MTWLILKTEPNKERKVATAIEALGFNTFCPMDVRAKPLTRRRWGKITETPLIPRIVFARLSIQQIGFGFRGEVSILAPSNWANSFEVVENLLGYAKDAPGGVLIIPAPQMTQFIQCHTTWFSERLNAYRQNTPPKPRKPISRKWTETSFQEIAKELFGVEIA